MASLTITQSTMNGRTVYKVGGKWFYSKSNAVEYVRRTGHSVKTKKPKAKRVLGKLHPIDMSYEGALDNPATFVRGVGKYKQTARSAQARDRYMHAAHGLYEEGLAGYERELLGAYPRREFARVANPRKFVRGEGKYRQTPESYQAGLRYAAQVEDMFERGLVGYEDILGPMPHKKFKRVANRRNRR